MPTIAFIWILIPLTAMLLKAFREWLRFRARQEQLGASHQRAIAVARAENDALRRRVENLEAVVTSRLWEAAREGTPSADLARLDLALSDLPRTPSRTEQLEELAVRLGV